MMKFILKCKIHIFTRLGRSFRALWAFLCFKRDPKKPVFRLKKYAPGSLEMPLVRHRDYDLKGVWDE